MSYPTLIDYDNYNIDIGYNMFLIDCTSTNINIYLPQMLYDGISFFIKRIDNSTNTLSLHVNSTDNVPIDDSTSTLSIQPYEYIELFSYNSKWWITDK